MDRELYERANKLFEALCDTDLERRAERLDQLCDGDEVLRAEVEEMLAADQDSSIFLDRTTGGGVAMALARDMALSACTTELTTGRPPEAIGPYRILRKLGAGGMGVVYEAEQEHPRRKVALKCIHTYLHTDKLREQFRFEAQAMGQLLHPGIPQVYEASEADGQLYLVMELVDGEPLHKFLRRRNPTRDQLIRLLIRLCDATHHAHARGVIHRDLKPANILMTTSRQPKILDFGIATATRQEEGKKAPRMGTPAYMSPEQLEQGGDVDARADVYALGVIAFEALEGRLPFRTTSSSLDEMIEAMRAGPPPLALGTDLVSRDLEAIVRRAMAPQREDRYRTASAMARDLRRVARSEPIQAMPATPRYRTEKWIARHRSTLRPVLAVLVLVALTLAGIALTREATRRWRHNQLEQSAVQGLSAMQTQVARHLSEGDTEGADAAFEAFVDNELIRDTRAVTQAWIGRAASVRTQGRTDLELEALSRAYATAPDRDLRIEALTRLAWAFHDRWDWDALEVVLASLEGEQTGGDDLRALTVAARLGRGDLHGAAELLGDDPRTIGPVVSALNPFTPAADEAFTEDLNGDGTDDLMLWNQEDLSIHIAAATSDLQPAVELVQPSGIGDPGRVFVIPGDPARLAVSYSSSDGVFRMFPVTPEALAGQPLVEELVMDSLVGHSFHAADIDGDGAQEVYVAGAYRERGVLRLDHHPESDTWTSSIPHPPTNRLNSDISVILDDDLDGDGRDELVVGTGPWLAYSARVYGPGPDHTLKLIDQVRLGTVTWIKHIDLATGESGVAALALHHLINPSLLGEGETGFAEPGLYFLDMAPGGELQSRLLAALPAPVEGKQPGYWNLYVADLDGDGLHDMAVGTMRGPMLLLRQLPDGSFTSALVGGGRPLAAIQADGDPAAELVMRGAGPDRQVCVLGVGEERRTTADVTAPQPVPKANPSLGPSWNAARDLVAMGLSAEAARIIEDGASMSTDATEVRLARLWAAALYESLDQPRDAARLHEQVLRVTPDDLEATRGQARAQAMLHNFPDAADAYERLAAHPDATENMAQEAEDALSWLRVAAAPAPRYELNLSRPLPPPWQVQWPVSLRWVAGREELVMRAMSNQREVATLPMSATGPRYTFEATFTIEDPDLPSYLAIGVRPVGGRCTDGLGVKVIIWGGGGLARRQIDGYAPGKEYFHDNNEDSRIELLGYHETFHVLVTYVPGVGSRAEVRDEAGDLLFEVTDGSEAPAPSGEYELVLGIPDNEPDFYRTLMTARITQLSLEGFEVVERESDVAALTLVNGDPAGALLQLEKDDLVRRAHALADLGRLDEAAAVAAPLAATAPRDLMVLLRLHGTPLIEPLYRELGDVFYELYDEVIRVPPQDGTQGGALYTAPFSRIPGTTPAQRRLMLHRAEADVQRGLEAQARVDLERLKVGAGTEELDVLRRADLLLARMAIAAGNSYAAQQHVQDFLTHSPDPQLACEYIERQPKLAAIPCDASAD